MIYIYIDIDFTSHKGMLANQTAHKKNEEIADRYEGCEICMQKKGDSKTPKMYTNTYTHTLLPNGLMYKQIFDLYFIIHQQLSSFSIKYSKPFL